jgi:ketosteroid isomerase-like protein
MMFRSLLFALVLLIWSVQPAVAETIEDLARQVREAESAFADTMAKRDLKAFATYLDDEAVFFGGKDALRGKAAVVEGWKAFFDGPNAPFSWMPESVEVLDSGALAHSSGPVYDPQGKRVATFNSIWRRDEDGRWRVVFDKGCDACACASKPDQ